MWLQKIIRINLEREKNSLCCRLESSRIIQDPLLENPDPLVRGTDPRIRIRAKMSRIRIVFLSWISPFSPSDIHKWWWRTGSEGVRMRFVLCPLSPNPRKKWYMGPYAGVDNNFSFLLGPPYTSVDTFEYTVPVPDNEYGGGTFKLRFAFPLLSTVK